MIEVIVLVFLGIACLGLVVFYKDNSIFIPLSIAGVVSVGFVTAWIINSMWALVIFSIPFGYMLAWFARDELRAGRKWFKAICALFLVLLGISIVFKSKNLMMVSIFSIITSAISIYKSYDRRWTKQRI